MEVVVGNRRPEVPAYLEFIGHIVMELLGCFGDSVFNKRVVIGLRAVIVDIDALPRWSFIEADGIDRSRGDAFVPADDLKLAQYAGKRAGQCLKAEVWKPHAEIELVGHDTSLISAGRKYLVSAARERAWVRRY